MDDRSPVARVPPKEEVLPNDVVASLTHDLRNPLNAILLSAEVLRRGLPPDDDFARMRRQVDTVCRAAEQIERRLKALMDDADLAAGRLDLELAACAAGELLDDAIQWQVPAAAAKRVVLTRGDVDPAARASCDLVRTQRILADLFRAALRASPPGATVHCGVRIEPGAGVVVSITSTFAREDLAALSMPPSSALRPGLQMTSALALAQGGRVRIMNGGVELILPEAALA